MKSVLLGIWEAFLSSSKFLLSSQQWGRQAPLGDCWKPSLRWLWDFSAPIKTWAWSFWHNRASSQSVLAYASADKTVSTYTGWSWLLESNWQGINFVFFKMVTCSQDALQGGSVGRITRHACGANLDCIFHIFSTDLFWVQADLTGG